MDQTYQSLIITKKSSIVKSAESPMGFTSTSPNERILNFLGKHYIHVIDSQSMILFD